MGFLPWNRRRQGPAARAGDAIELALTEISEGRLQRSMALVAGFAAVVSGWEAYSQHQRGAFSHWLMWTPVWLTPPTALACVAALFSKKAARRVLPLISLVSFADGVIGFIFHIKAIQEMPGGFKLGQYNIVMGPPVFAPLLTCMTGVTGLLTSAVRREKPSLSERAALIAEISSQLEDMITKKQPSAANWRWRVAHGEFQRPMALTAATFAALAGGEAYFEHMRGSYNQRVMWSPVWITPAMIGAALGAVKSEQVASVVLPVASLVTLSDGLLGFVLHLRGIREMPGGFANLRFNMTMGPPLFAPLLFAAVGLLGMLAALLRRKVA